MTNSTDKPALPASLVSALRRAKSVVVLTGAGVSAESGIPTYRDAADSLWSVFNPEEYASPEAWRRDPARVWRWYVERRAAMATAAPNAAHRALARWERQVPDFTVVTQNIDGLHPRAGTRNLIEIHGNLFRQRPQDDDAWQCPVLAGMDEPATSVRDRFGSDYSGAEPTTGVAINGLPPEDAMCGDLSFTCPSAMLADTASLPPSCGRCGARIRPDVVWFGEPLSAADLHRAVDAAARCDVCVVAGTSSTVEPAASLAFVALDQGATVIEVNPESTPLTPYATFVLRGPAGTHVAELVDAALGFVEESNHEE